MKNELTDEQIADALTIKINGYDVLIDREDYERLKTYKYNLHSELLKKKGRCYFFRKYTQDGHQHGSSLHRDIMGCVSGDGMTVDHKNNNTLDCRKRNLRLCTISQNTMNSKRPCTNTSGIKFGRIE